MLNKKKIKLCILATAILASTVPMQSVAASNIAEGNVLGVVAQREVSGKQKKLEPVIKEKFCAGVSAAIWQEPIMEVDSNVLLAGISKNELPRVTAVNHEYTDMAIAQINSYLNIRAEANENSEVLGKLYPNGAGIVLEQCGEWTKIQSGKVTGYVATQYIVIGDIELCKSAADRIGTVNVDGLRIRKAPNEEAEIFKTLNNGDEIEVEADLGNGWYKLMLDDEAGYVAAEYLTVETRYTYAESKEDEAIRLEAERKAREAKKKKNDYTGENKKYDAPEGMDGQSVANYAVQFVGNPYVWGGESLTNGADCSGFVKSIYKQFGVDLPHSSSSLRGVGYKVDESDIRPGDIVCYSGHVAIYIGDGKIVHASSSKTGIIISNNYKYRNVITIRRIF